MRMKKQFLLTISKYYLLAVTLLLVNQVSAQDMEDLKKLGRDSIISLATEQLELRLSDHPEFNIDIYDQIKVWAGEDILMVEFHISKVYIPQNTSYNTHVSYVFKNKVVSYTQQDNGPENFIFYDQPEYPEYVKKLVPELGREMDAEYDERLLVIERVEKIAVEHRVQRYSVRRRL